MGEWSDWGGFGLPGGDADVSTAGAGGDPYGGGDYEGFGDDLGEYGEAAPTGALPGGSENQFTPFSPNGGFDFTDTIRGMASYAAQPLFGRGGSIYDSGLPNLGVMPMPPPPGAGGPGGMWPTFPARPIRPRSCGPIALSAASGSGDIVRYVRETTGLRVTARSIVGLIVRYGFRAAAALTQLDFGSLLKLFMRQKGVTHHRRGPGLYTVARKLRAADRLRHTAARILGRAHGAHRARARAPGRRFGGRFRRRAR